MAIVARCGSCGKRFEAQPHLAGKTVPCPFCGRPLSVPMAPAAAGNRVVRDANRPAAAASAPAQVGCPASSAAGVGLASGPKPTWRARRCPVRPANSHCRFPRRDRRQRRHRPSRHPTMVSGMSCCRQRSHRKPPRRARVPRRRIGHRPQSHCVGDRTAVPRSVAPASPCATDRTGRFQS